VNSTKKAYLLTALCVLAWSLIPVVSKLATQDVSSMQFLLLSNALSAMMAFIVAFTRRPSWRALSTNLSQSLWRTALPGFLGCYFYYLCLYHGYARADGINVLVIQYLWPVLVVLLAPMFFPGRIRLPGLLAVTLGFLGAAIVATRGDVSSFATLDLTTLGIVLAGASAFALFTLLSPRVAGDAATNVFLFFAWATMLSWVTVALGDGWRLPSSWRAWVGLLANGCVINGISYFWWLRASQLVNPARLAPLVFVAPVLATVWLVVIFNAPFHPIYAAGLGLCLIAGYLATRVSSHN
jgi:drug/metabolite transporter (DMT)-like permease